MAEAQHYPLPDIRILGPNVSSGGDAPTVDFLWKLETQVPSYKGLSSEDADDIASSVDEAHPMRVLAMDTDSVLVDAPLGGGLGTQQVRFFEPRLLRATIFQKDPKAKLTLKFWNGTDFTKIVLKGRTTGNNDKDFVTLVLEPRPDVDGFKQNNDHIDLPPARSVLGDIEVEFSPSEAKKLKALGWVPGTPLRLTPDGIVFAAELPFPGSTKLAGVFLLAPAAGTASGSVMRLLPEKLDSQQTAAWGAAWNLILPDERNARSVGIRARRSTPPPAFAWSVEIVGGKLKLGERVQIPESDASVILMGSSDGKSTPDGVAALLGSMRVATSTIAGTVEFTCARSTTFNKWALELSLPAPGAETFQLKGTSGPIPVEHDERILAQQLRNAYGLDGHAELYGFVAAERGWLQFPTPNLPPVDNSFDDELVGEVADEEKSAIDGFVRWSASSPRTVLSAYPSNNVSNDLLVPNAPWSFTTSSATGFDVSIHVTPGQEAKIVRARVALYEPEVGTRGLLWLSQDRPDAEEALPRLGAGPGSFIDVPLEVNRAPLDPQRSVRFSVASVSGDAFTRSLTGRTLNIEGRVDGDSVLWQRHPSMPLAATMPMTRSGNTTSRPLESRDLAPFKLTATPAAPDGFSKLATLEYGSQNPFPKVTAGAGPTQLRRHDSWLWGGDSPNRGIAFAALGVPGMELVPKQAGGWKDLLVAGRYDLPALDEAFATARIVGEKPDPASVVSEPIATALDFGAMEAFWHRQSQRHELTRVQDSYLFEFKDSPSTNVDVKTLVAPATWSVKCGFEVPPEPPTSLPYGKLLVREKPTSGDEALLPEEDVPLKREGDTLTALDANVVGTITVTGWSPSIYRFTQNGVAADFDNRGFGVTTPDFTRAVHATKVIVNKSVVELVTAKKTIEAKIGSVTYQLWFKDLPLTGKKFANASLSIDPNAWDLERAPVNGYEFRFFRSDVEKNNGDEPIPLFGFGFSVLNLQELTLGADDSVDSATIIGRLSLAHDVGRPVLGNNLVKLVFVKDGDGLKLKDDANTNLNLGPLSFPLTVKERSGHRLVTLTIPAIKYTSAKMKIENAHVRFRSYAATWQFSFGSISTLPGDDAIVFALSPPLTNPEALEAHLRAEKIVLTAAPESSQCKLDFETSLVLSGPKPKTGTPAIAMQLPSNGLLSLFGYAIKPSESDGKEEAAGALVLTFDPKGQTVTGCLCDGFPVSENQEARGFLAVSFGPRSDGSKLDQPLPVIAGRVEMEITGKIPTEGMVMRKVRIQLEANRRNGNSSSTWQGGVALFGAVLQQSAICWPTKVTTQPATIPLPKSLDRQTRVQKGSRVDVTVQMQGPADLARHEVHVALDGQLLRMADFGKRSDGALAVLAGRWDALALVNHQLSVNGRDLRWSSVEPVSFLTAAELANLYPKEGGKELTVFAARYRKDYKPADEHAPPAQMISPGFGKRCSMLAGADGYYFRTAFKGVQNEIKNLIVAGGFTGALSDPKNDSLNERHALLRIPFLAEMYSTSDLTPKERALGPGKLQQTQSTGSRTYRLNWADTELLPKLLLSTRHAVSPRGPRPTELLDAALASAYRLSMTGAPILDPEPLRAATRLSPQVEQSFPLDIAPRGNASLAETAFWVSSVGPIARLLEPLSQPKQQRALSLVAGYVSEDDGKKRRVFSAVFVTDPRADLAPSTPELGDAFISLGQDVVEEPLGRLKVGPAIANRAFITHPRPRIAVIRESVAGAITYTAVSLPLPGLAEIPPHQPIALPAPDFPAPQRGYARAPFGNANSIPAWLYPPLLGKTSAVIDRKKGDSTRSGVAGLADRFALPRFTGNPAAPGKPLSDLVWMTETRIPPYLSLKLTDLKAPAIRWLSTAPPRLRLPLSSESKRALDAAQVSPDASRRAFLPPAASSATLGERAGILTVRRRYLMANLPGAEAFDPSVARFGQPAQAGQSIIRQIRTPRPGPLPPNTGDEQRDRRPCESVNEHERVAHYLAGPIEMVSGSDAAGRPWSILVTAMPNSRGCVSDLWDGSVRLQFKVFQHPLSEQLSPLEAVWKYLFRKDGDTGILETRAHLEAGTGIQHYSSIHFVLPAVPAVVEAILDARSYESSVPGPPLPILSPLADSLQTVRLHLTIHPGENKPGALELGKFMPLPTDQGPPIPHGATRAPVTLMFPLAPVSSSKGGLPLVPATVVFRDPAYDRDLVNLTAEVSVRPEFEKATPPTLPKGRGDLLAVLSLDRKAYEAGSAVALMADFRMERKPATALANDEFAVNGTVEVRLAVIRHVDGERKELQIAPNAKSANLKVSNVYEYSLKRLCDRNGAPTSLEPGDMLEVTSTWSGITLTYQGAEFPIVLKTGLTVLVPITEEPATQPPSALYAALELADGRLSVPLHAQSPLPYRIDAEHMKQDLRDGVVRRKAVFRWYTARYLDQDKPPKIYVLKQDRNGQTHVPEEKEFIELKELDGTLS